jgi:hypothetical protein
VLLEKERILHAAIAHAFARGGLQAATFDKTGS